MKARGLFGLMEVVSLSGEVVSDVDPPKKVPEFGLQRERLKSSKCMCDGHAFGSVGIREFGGLWPTTTGGAAFTAKNPLTRYGR